MKQFIVKHITQFRNCKSCPRIYLTVRNLASLEVLQIKIKTSLQSFMINYYLKTESELIKRFYLKIPIEKYPFFQLGKLTPNEKIRKLYKRSQLLITIFLQNNDKRGHKKSPVYKANKLIILRPLKSRVNIKLNNWELIVQELILTKSLINKLTAQAKS